MTYDEVYLDVKFGMLATDIICDFGDSRAPEKHPQHIDLAILRLWSRHHKVTNKMCQQKVTNKRFHQIHVKNIIIFEMLTEMNLTTGFLIFPVNVNLLALRIENVFTVYVCTVNEFHNF